MKEPVSAHEIARKTSLIELQYFPCVAYFAVLLTAPENLIEGAEYYEKQTYRNRCYIRAANQIDCLTVPVKRSNSKQYIRDVEIDYSLKWQHQHWQAICSAYGKSPFFEYFAPDFEKIFNTDYKYLFDLNYDLLTLCLKSLGQSVRLNITKEYVKYPEEAVIDLRSAIHPKKDMDLLGFFSSAPYNQLFGKEFAQNLSVLDLLFCEGPNAAFVVRQSLNN
jgi:hypothetical protein